MPARAGQRTGGHGWARAIGSLLPDELFHVLVALLFEFTSLVAYLYEPFAPPHALLPFNPLFPSLVSVSIIGPLFLDSFERIAPTLATLGITILLGVRRDPEHDQQRDDGEPPDGRPICSWVHSPSPS
jgi:hypothetical protein